MSNTKFLDLDAVVSPVSFQLKLGGKKHEMVEPTLEQFLETMRELEALPMTLSPTEEVEHSIKMIKRAFPTVEDAMLRTLKVTQLRQLNDFMRKATGQAVEQEVAAGEGSEGNPQTAD
jgi:glucokinase